MTVIAILSVYRHELKYLLSRVQALKLQEQLDVLLLRDKYSKQGAYTVRSLYFDSVNNIDYYTKTAGTEERKKIRLRVYSPDAELCKLEMKQKNGALQHKVSLLITRSEAQRLIDGDFACLLDYGEENSAAMQIYTAMALGCYRPKVLVEYKRIAYTYGLYNTRLTLDMQVRSSEACFDLFGQNPLYVPITEENVILEVKYNKRLVGFISRILKQYNLTDISVSKYCEGRKIYTDFNY